MAYREDIFVIAVPADVGCRELLDRVEKKIKLCGGGAEATTNGRLRVRYQDEDGDFITINSDDDVVMAFESSKGRTGGGGGVVNLYVK